VTKDASDPTGVLEVAFEKAVAAEEAERKLDRAIRAGTVRRYHGLDWFAEAIEKGVLSAEEADQLRELEALTARVIAVDHFDPAEVKPLWGAMGHNSQAAE
jgi:acyl-CoA dehydrogenase